MIKNMNCVACGNQLSDIILKDNSIHENYKCSQCLLVQIDLKNRSVSKKIHEKEFWKEDSDYRNFTGTKFTDKKVQDLVLSWNSWFSTFEKFFDKKNLLDVGSGTGISLVKFEEKDFEVLGIEPDNENVLKINKILNRGKCIHGFIESIEIGGKFDIIWSSHSLEHLEDPNLCFKKVFNLLKNNGVFCVVVPDGENIESLKNSVRNRFHLFHFSKNSLKKIGENNGFEVEYISSYRIMRRNIFRIHKILRKCGLVKLSNLFFPHYPFEETNSDGEEIRICFKKSAN
ncbi:methyltransferase domain-containing protein [Nitrosopumilus sp.]|uniref:class I SAM-dependent methyltransferase n=1 Tax=Nitrosopumilus sp. TaxID=2024843 RepID=UPI003D0BE9A2